MPKDDRRAARQPLPAGFGVIWTTVVIDLIGFGIALPVLGPYAKDRFDAGGTAVGLLMASYSLAQFVCAPILGRLSDRYGRKPVLMLSLIGTAAASLATGLAGSLWILLLVRTLDGVSGASTSVAQAAVADLATPERRTHLLGLLGAAFGIGFTLGPAIGGLASWLGGPRTPFFVAAALAGTNAVVAWFRLPETKASHEGDVSSQSSAGAEPHAHSAPLPRSVALARTWRENGMPVLISVGAASMFAFSAFEATFSLFGKERIGFTHAQAGIAFTIIGLMVSAVQGGLVRRVTPIYGDAAVLRFGLFATACGLAVVAVTNGWLLLVPALALLCLGQGLAAPALTSSVISKIAPEHRGAVLGAHQSAQALGRVAGPALGGLAFDRIGFSAPYAIGAAICAACAATLVLARRPGPAPLPT